MKQETDVCACCTLIWDSSSQPWPSTREKPVCTNESHPCCRCSTMSRDRLLTTHIILVPVSSVRCADFSPWSTFKLLRSSIWLFVWRLVHKIDGEEWLPLAAFPALLECFKANFKGLCLIAQVLMQSCYLAERQWIPQKAFYWLPGSGTLPTNAIC